MTELKSEIYILYYTLFQAKHYSISTEANFRTTFSSNELYNETRIVLKSAFQNLKANHHVKHNQVNRTLFANKTCNKKVKSLNIQNTKEYQENNHR